MFKKDYGYLASFLISTILGIIVGFTVYNSIIVGIVTTLWIGFGIGICILMLLGLMTLLAHGREEKCICIKGPCLAISAIGTIITTIIGLAITIETGIVLIAILIGVATLFLAMTLFSLLQLILRLIQEKCKCRE